MLELLEHLNINIALSIYMEGLITNLRVKNGKVILSSAPVERPMGMWFDGENGWVGSHSGVTRYENIALDSDYCAYRPTFTSYHGYLDTHEVIEMNNSVVINATLFDRVVTLSQTKDFYTIYKPPFVDDPILANDANHINGLGMCDGYLRFITGFSDRNSSEVKGWKENPNTGFVWDLRADKPILSNLTLPHTPRVRWGELHVCNSGRGELLIYNLATTYCHKLHLDSFIRGLAFHDKYIFVGCSKTRNASKQIIPETLQASFCGIIVLDRLTFSEVGRIDLNEYMDDSVTEIFDIVIMPGNTVVMPPTADAYRFFHQV